MLFHNIPKIELHCHLDGSVRPSTLFELTTKAGLTEKTTLTDFDSLIRVPSNCQSLVEYLNCFALPIAVMQTEENLERIGRELIEDVAQSNVKYIEVRFAPHLHMKNGLTFDQVVSSVLRGLDQGRLLTGTRSNLILCCMRHLPVSVSMEVVHLGQPFLGKGVVAIDLAGDEAHFPPKLHEAAFQKAKDLGYHITVHAGETGIAQNVTDAIQHLHAERIGHGLFIKDDPEAYALVKESQTALEMCPTSNVQTQGVSELSAHPILAFLRGGLLTTLNTDNMTVSGITLETECNALSEVLNLQTDDVWLLYKNAIEASFASVEDKDYLRSFIPTI